MDSAEQLNKNSKLSTWMAENLPTEVLNGTLFKFTIAVGSNKIQVDLTADVVINYSNIQEELENSPSVFTYWAAVYSELRMELALTERRVKARRGLLIDTMLKEAKNEGTRITDRQVQAIVEGDKVLNEFEIKMILLNKHVGKLNFMLEALRMKTDNLRSLSGFAKIDYNNAQ